MICQIIYAVLIALKIAGIALVTTSWWIVAGWLPALCLVILLLNLAGVGVVAAFEAKTQRNRFKRK